MNRLELIVNRADITTEAYRRATRENPTSHDLRRVRELLNCTQSQFASAIGFSDGERTIRAWENDEMRHGVRAVPTGTALQAIRLLCALDAARRCTTIQFAQAMINDALPEFMRNV